MSSTSMDGGQAIQSCGAGEERSDRNAAPPDDDRRGAQIFHGLGWGVVLSLPIWLAIGLAIEVFA